MSSVTTEAAIRTPHASIGSKLGTKTETRSQDGFSALFESNTEAAAESRGDSQPSFDRSVGPERAEDSTESKGSTAAPRLPKTVTKPTDDGKRTDATIATTEAVDDQPSTAAVADVVEMVKPAGDEILITILTSADSSSPLDGKGDETSAKTDDTDTATGIAPGAGLAQPIATPVPATIVVTIIPEAAAGPSPTPIDPVPGAIATAAANRVAADLDNQPLDAQAKVEVDGKLTFAAQAGSQPAASSDEKSSTAAATPLEVLTQANVAAQIDQPATPTAKRNPIDATVNASTTILKPAAVDQQALTQVANTDVDPQTTTEASPPKRPAGAAHPEREAPPQLEVKPDRDAEGPAIAGPRQHFAMVEQRAALQTSALTSDFGSSTTLQSAGITNGAASIVTNNAPLNLTHLTVVTGAAVPLSGLAVEISANARMGNSRFEIRLDPPELGRIDVRLDVDRTGQVTSRLFVEKSETLELLRRDAPQLQQALQDAGLKTGDNGLQFSLRDQNPQGRNDNNASGQNGQRLIIVEDDAVMSENAGRSYSRPLTASGGVDIRV